MEADLYIHNARIWTGDPARPWASSLLVRSGRIVGIDLPQPPLCERIIDADGRTITPGLIDAHMHLITGGLALADLDLRSVRSREEFEQRIAEQHESLPPGQWLIARNWSEHNWGGISPEKSWLAPAGDRPVVCYRMDLHAAIVNDAVLALCDLNTSLPDGKIVRDPRTGDPTGLMIEGALWKLINPLVPEPTAEAKQNVLRKAQQHCHSFGITAVGSMEYAREVRDVLLPLSSDMTLRCAVTLLDRKWPLDLAQAHELSIAAGGKLSVIGCKAFADGTFGSRTAKMLEDYADDPGNSGMFVELAAELRLNEWAAHVAREGLSPSIHAIGDQAVRLALNAFESLPHGVVRRIEHTQQIDPADIPRFAGLGVIASMQPLHKADDGRFALSRLGGHRLAGFFPFRQLLNNHAEIAFGSDWPVVTCDPIAGMRAAITGLTLDNTPIRTEENITPEEALRAYTSSAVKALGMDDVGTIAEGRTADLAFFSINPLEADWPSNPPMIDMTMVDGEIVFDRRRNGANMKVPQTSFARL